MDTSTLPATPTHDVLRLGAIGLYLGEQAIEVLTERVPRVLRLAAGKVADRCLTAAASGRDLGLAHAMSLEFGNG